MRIRSQLQRLFRRSLTSGQILMEHESGRSTPPFDSLSNEILANIFAQIHEIGYKTRLERVCKRFQLCLQLAQAWKFDTKLDTSRLTLPESISLLKHAGQLTITKIRLHDNPKIRKALVKSLLAQTPKFKLSELDICLGDQCDGVKPFLLNASHYFHHSLQAVRLRNAHSDKLAMALLQDCHRLKNVSLNMDGYKNYRAVLAALHNKPLRSLTLRSYAGKAQPIRATPFAAVINSVTGHTLCEFSLVRCLLNNDFPDFLSQLQPTAAQAIKHIRLELWRYDQTLGELLELAPALLPNLSRVTVVESHRITVDRFRIYALAIVKFLSVAVDRADPVELHFLVRRNSDAPTSSPRSWWNTFSFMIACRSEGDMQGFPGTNHWQQIIQEHNAAVVIRYDKED